jgi:hypothetical protein
VGLFGVFGDAARLYVLLWRHSLPAAALAAAVVWLIDSAWDRVHLDTWLELAIALLSVLVYFSAPLVVQGMLVELVRNLHDGTRAAEIRALVAHALGRLPALLVGSAVYWICFVVGLALLIVPGLLVLSRWCLLAPLIVLERRDPFSAISRSSELVYGRTFPVLLIVGPVLALEYWVPDRVRDRFDSELAHYAVLVLVTPYVAHVLTALYYRLTDPERPVIAERRPGSPWDEHALDDARRAR